MDICRKQSIPLSIIASELKIIELAEKLDYAYEIDYEFVGQDQSDVFTDGIIFKNKNNHFIRITRTYGKIEYEIDNEKTKFAIGDCDTYEVLIFLEKYVNY